MSHIALYYCHDVHVAVGVTLLGRDALTILMMFLICSSATLFNDVGKKRCKNGDHWHRPKLVPFGTQWVNASVCTRVDSGIERVNFKWHFVVLTPADSKTNTGLGGDI